MTAQQYVAQIRNHNKQAYAQAYLEHLGGLRAQPDPTDYDLSYMAAQAVRMRLADLPIAHFEPQRLRITGEPADSDKPMFEPA